MGKSSKLKLLRKIAKELPYIERKIAVPGETLRGSELINKGLTTLRNGTLIKEDHFYREGKIINQPLNHNRILKQQYNKGGMNAAGDYTKAIVQYADSKKVETFST